MKQVSSTRQACAYGLGVAADVGGPEFDAYAPMALRLLLALVEGPEAQEEENSSVSDNAISAALKVVLSRAPALASSLAEGGMLRENGSGMSNGSSNSNRGDVGSRKEGCDAAAAALAAESEKALLSLFESLLSKLPLSTDVSEGQVCHARIIRLAAAGDPRVLGGAEGLLVPTLVVAIAGMMAYQLSPQEQEMAAMEGSGMSCDTGSAARENEGEMWARQLLDKETREAAEGLVGTLRERFPARFEEAWGRMEEEDRRAMQMSTASIRSSR